MQVIPDPTVTLIPMTSFAFCGDFAPLSLKLGVTLVLRQPFQLQTYFPKVPAPGSMSFLTNEKKLASAIDYLQSSLSGPASKQTNFLDAHN